jgi:hypothetical protein
MVLAGESTPAEMLLWLLLVHFLCDFGLQSDRMAREKCSGCDATLPWGWWLTAHASIHGLGVGVVTGSPSLALAELLLHALIDRLKCQRCYGITADQLLHLACKLLWVGWIALR